MSSSLVHWALHWAWSLLKILSLPLPLLSSTINRQILKKKSDWFLHGSKPFSHCSRSPEMREKGACAARWGWGEHHYFRNALVLMLGFEG